MNGTLGFFSQNNLQIGVTNSFEYPNSDISNVQTSTFIDLTMDDTGELDK